jgi:hypothetical protein
VTNEAMTNAAQTKRAMQKTNYTEGLKEIKEASYKTASSHHKTSLLQSTNKLTA